MSTPSSRAFLQLASQVRDTISTMTAEMAAEATGDALDPSI